MRFYQLGEIKSGKLSYNREKMQHFIEKLDDGTYLMSLQRIEPKSDIKDYRACYFAKIDILKDEVGEGRYDLHELVKENVISVMADEVSEVFLHEEWGLSTRNLTLEGWRIFLERFDLWAFTEYNVILP
jgi:hypothetical protein